ncbi:MAG: hypothetical protein H7836_11420 [Magnetococcus sp. YQC-3]
MSEVFDDVREKLRLKQVVDQSTVTFPPGNNMGDLPVIFSNVQDPVNQESLTKMDKRERGLTSLLGAISDVGASEDPDDLDFFVERFLFHFFSGGASVDGWRASQLTQMCAGELKYEKRFKIASIKKQEKEDFV